LRERNHLDESAARGARAFERVVRARVADDE
jgi:hypothetical protein